MKHHSKQPWVDIHTIEIVVRSIFPSGILAIERIAEGVSTYVYRISTSNEIFYLRVLPEEGASFTPEAVVHTRLKKRQVKVPEIIHIEPRNELLQRSIMVTTEIKGQSINQSSMLRKDEMDMILREAGRDLARINTMQIEGFGWVQRDLHATQHLRAEWPNYLAFALEYRQADLAYLANNTLSASEVGMIERILPQYDYYLDNEQGYLAHGDFDTNHVYQEGGCYTGIIDFGEIRGADPWYDTGHFHMRDGEHLPFRLEAALVHGYGEIIPLPSDYEQRIRFTSLLINVEREDRRWPTNGMTPPNA